MATDCKLRAALDLPPRLLTPCLRAEWLHCIDLSNPGPSWNGRQWRRLVSCMHAIPLLQSLSVSLPKYPRPFCVQHLQASNIPCGCHKILKQICGCDHCRLCNGHRLERSCDRRCGPHDQLAMLCYRDFLGCLTVHTLMFRRCNVPAEMAKSINVFKSALTAVLQTPG